MDLGRERPLKNAIMLDISALLPGNFFFNGNAWVTNYMIANHTNKNGLPLN